jgi:hypothetical protein
MRRLHSIVLTVALLAVAPVLAGCESFDNFDPDKLDIFGLNKKKPLPGERRDVFPGGVPGVTQGIPPEFLKSTVEQQQQAEAAAVADQQKQDAAAATEETQKNADAAEKPKAKPKPKLVRVPAKPATQVTVQPAKGQPAQAPWPDANQQQQQQQPAQAPWPSQGQQQGQQQDAAWPAPPPAGTFSR